MAFDDFPPQTRQHYQNAIDPLPDLSAMPDPRGQQPQAQFDQQAFQQALQPGRNFLVNEPQELSGVAPISEGAKQADEFKDFFYSLPLGMRLGIAEQGGIPTLANQFMAQRQSAAAKQQQLQEQKRQHDLQMIEKLMATGNSEALIEYGKQNPDSPALLIGQSISKQNLADVLAGANEGMIPQEVMQRIMTKQATPTEIKAWGDTVVEARKANAKEQAKAHMLKTAMDTPKEKRTPYQQQLADEHETALNLKTADIELKNAQAAKAWMEASQGGQPRDLGIDREAYALQLFGQKYGQNVRYRHLLPNEQEQVNNAVAKFQGQVQGQRTAGAISGEMGSPIKDPAQWKMLNSRGRIQQLPPGTTREEALREGYRNIAGFDSEMKQIEAAPSSIAVIDTLHKYAREIITAGPGILSRGKQKLELSIAGLRQAGRPTKITGADGTPLTLGEVVDLYQKTAEANADLLSRAGGGQVGVATDKDTVRSLMNLAAQSDTANVMEGKFERFRKLFTDRYQQNLEIVFGKGESGKNAVDERLERIEKLLKQGKS